MINSPSHLLMSTQYNNSEVSTENTKVILAAINYKLDADIAAKQKTIDLHEKEIQRLHQLTEEKNSLLMQMTEKLTECARNNEGSRQLINKLLNDIDRLNQDVEWYRRTYEKRSLLGTIKEKIFHRK